MLKYLLVFNLILVASSLPILGLPRMSIDISASIFESILDQVKSTFTTTGPWARFGQEYFVQWNEGKWIECEIEKVHLDGSLDILAQNGQSGKYLGTQISWLGFKSAVGDEVIAYFDDGDYAVKGKHGKGTFADGRIFVELDDGNKGWVDAWKVHKLVKFQN